MALFVRMGAASNSQMPGHACAMRASMPSIGCARSARSSAVMSARRRSCWGVLAVCWRAGSSRVWDGLRLTCRSCGCICPPVKATWTPAPRTGCLAGVCRAAVACGHAGSCVGPGAHRAGGEPAFRGFRALAQRAGKALLDEALLDTTSRPQAWPTWAEQQKLDPAALRFGQAFEHLYYLLEAAVAGLGVAIAPQPLVADDLRAGRLSAPWGFSPTRAALALWVPRRAADGRAEQLAQWLRNELDLQTT